MGKQSSQNSDVGQLERHVRSTLNSRRRRTAPACPGCAIRGHEPSLRSLAESARTNEQGVIWAQYCDSYSARVKTGARRICIGNLMNAECAGSRSHHLVARVA